MSPQAICNVSVADILDEQRYIGFMGDEEETEHKRKTGCAVLQQNC
jgi:hypothetical protein